MLKKTITYTDYNGNERTEDFYFNLTKAELMETEMGINGGYAELIQSVVKAQDAPSIIRIFKEIVLKAYGEKSLDGRRFVKNDEIQEAFSQTEAYSQLFMELATDDKVAANFINAIIPSDMAKEVAKQNGGVMPTAFPTTTPTN